MIDGRLIRHFRYTHGYSARDLAKLIGVSATSLREWERGERQPSPENEEKLRGFMFPGRPRDTEKEKSK